MTIYDLKPAFQNLLRPVTQALAKAGVSANQITLLAMLLSIGLSLALVLTDDQRVFLLLPVFLFLRMALNAIDGMLAREHDMKSPLGAILNELGDVVSDTALYLPFALVAGVSPALVVSVVVLAMLSEMSGVVAVQIGASRRYDGPMGKSDRAFVFSLLGLTIGFGVPTGTWTDLLLGVMAALLVVTTINRARKALAEVSR